MTPKENGEMPAHPDSAVWDGNRSEVSPGGAYFNLGGLTKREAFAMCAPPPHSTFEWWDPQEQAAVDAAKADMLATMPRQNSEDNSLLNRMESWHRDPCYDLVGDNPAEQPIIEAFTAAHEKWIKARTEQHQNHPVKQRAAWARAYADALLDELHKGQA